MKSNSKVQNSRLELKSLQNENISLRSQLKDLGSRLNTLIELKDQQSPKKYPNYSTSEEELKEAKKLTEIYKKEKQYLEKRLKKVLDVDYFNKLSLKISRDTKRLNELINLSKSSELTEKKESFIKINDNSGSDLDFLTSKRLKLMGNIKKLQDYCEKNKETITENENKVKELESECKRLTERLGEPYLKEKSIKKMMEVIQKKKKVEKIIIKETNSKVNVMVSKIKELQSELQSLKHNELEMSSQILSATKQVQNYNENIRLTPILGFNKSATENRSHSVRPHIYKSFFPSY